MTQSSTFVALVLVLFFLSLTRVRGGTITWKHPPSPSQTPIPSPSVVGETITNVTTSYVPLLRQGDAFNESVTVPMTERTDTASPLPAMVAAEDFSIPLALQTCHCLVADLVLFRQLGRTGNYRVPSHTTFWLFSDAQTTGPFNRSRALAERIFSQPSEGQYDPPGSTGGATTDHGNGYYYHVERLRFVLSNLTLRSNTTYWLAALVSIDRAYNATDFSQNTVRWAVSESSNNITGSRPYRVVDWHHNTFRDVPSLVNWTNATAAESSILSSMTALNVHASRTHQLALNLYATECINVTRLPTSLALLAALPLRDASQVHSPVPSSSPSYDVVAVTTPSPVESSPNSSSSSSSTPAVGTPSSEWPSPPPSPMPTSTSTWSPSPTPTGVLPSPIPTPMLSPLHEPTWISPSPSQAPITTGSGNSPSEKNENVSVTQVPRASNSNDPIDARTWVYVGVAAIVLLALLVVVFVVAVRRFRGNRRYTALTHKDYVKESSQDPPSTEDEELVEGSDLQLPRYTDKPSSLLTDDSGDAAQIRLDDNDAQLVVTTRQEAKAKQSSLLMQEVSLDKKT
jgi:hypothetical protein